MTSLGASFCHREPQLDIISKMKLILAVLTTFLINYAFAQWEIDVKIEPKEVQIGEPVNISCHLKRHSPPPQLLSVGWKRRIGDEEIQVASNQVLTVLDKNKYSASMEVMKNTKKDVYFVFHIMIQNARPQDSGQWGCVHPEDNGAATETVYRNLTVVSQVTSIKLYSKDKDTGMRKDYTDNEEVMMEDGDEMTMTCEVEGGYPRPDVQIKPGNKHVDKEFTGEPVLKTIGSGVDMKLEYHTLKVAEKFVASGHHSSKRLECSANVPASKSPALKIGILIKIEEFKPVFSCDQDTRLATLYERDVNLKCKVQANPPLTNGTVHFFRKITPKKKITIVNGEDKNHHVFQILNGTTEEEKIFRLHIGQLFPQSFRTYYFTAKNNLGHTVKELTIQPNPAYKVEGNTGASVKGISGAAVLGFMTMLLLATIFGDLATVPFCW